MENGARIGLAPGGIEEMFEGYPKPGRSPNEECVIVRRGFLRLAAKHRRPVVPIFCFGSSKLFHRLQSSLLERISLMLRASLVIFYGIRGLPIPFRQKLLYVVGSPVVPETRLDPVSGNNTTSTSDMEKQLDELYSKFCDELVHIFERNKESYGWGHKTLRIISR